MDISALSTHSVMQDIAAPSVAAVSVEFPPNRHTQDEVISALADFAGPEFKRFAATSGVATRQLALPLSRYPQLGGFTEANDAYLDIALELGERALSSALATAGMTPSDIDVIFSTTVAISTDKTIRNPSPPISQPSTSSVSG